MTMSKNIRVIGQQCCESYLLLGNNGHAVRSSLVEFDNGQKGVWCVFCGTALPTLIDSLFHKDVEHRQRIKPSDQSSAHQYQYHFEYGEPREGNFVYAVLSFYEPAQFQLTPENIGREFDASEFKSLPPKLAEIGCTLAAVGFEVVAPRDLDEFHAHPLRTITLVRGRHLVPGKPALDGVRVTLNYIV